MNRSFPVQSLAITIVTTCTLTSCGNNSPKAAVPSPDSGHVISVADTCGGALRAEAATAVQLLGSSWAVLGTSREQPTLEETAHSLRAAAPGGDGGSTNRQPLCTIHPEGVSATFVITFAWGQNNGAPALTTSTFDSSEYSGIGYEASSRDNDVLIDFSCVMQNAPTTADGRGMYIKATAETEGLDALPRAEKREAQVRVLYAAAVKVAAAMKCVTNLPTTLRTLTPLPPAR